MARRGPEADVVCLAPLLLLSLCLVAGQPDPCDSGQHTVRSDEYRRSMAYRAGPGQPLLCDARIREGWYRFVGGAGEDMVPCQGLLPPKCGTNKPVCLMDNLPSRDDGVVRRTVCRKSFSGCDRRWQIQIKNCGDFRVYRLTSSRGCDSAYCIGTKLKCRPNQCSEAGYSPCGDCPESFSLEPEVRVGTEYVEQPYDGASRNESRLVFSCEFSPPSTEITYDVHWYIQNKPVKVFKDVTQANLETTKLQEEHWPNIGLGVLISCSVRTRSPGNPVPSHHNFSSPFFAGLEVDKREIQVWEGSTAKLRVRSTIPPPHYTDPGGRLHSNLEIYVYAPPQSSSTASTVACTSNAGPDVAFDNPYTCGVKLNLTNYDEGVVMEVAGMVDNTYRGYRIAHLRMGAEGSALVNPFWESYTLPDVKVTILDRNIELSGKHCRSFTDPHMKTADGFIWENQRVGEFILYRHRTFPQAVHIKYQYCKGIQRSWKPTCNCGVAIQAYTSLLVVDWCSGNITSYTTHHVSHISYRGCDDKHLIISRTNNDYKVTLPTGTQVTFSAGKTYNFNWVHVYPSVADIGLSGGLCGKIDGIPGTGDFTLRDGTETTSADDFAENWRADESESLFVEDPPLTNTTVGRTYCTCGESTGDELVRKVNCNLTYPAAQCPQSQSDDRLLAAFLHQCGGSRRRRDLHLSDLVSDGPSGWQPVESGASGQLVGGRWKRQAAPEWGGGWNESSARAHCQEAFSRAAGISLLEQASRFSQAEDGSLDACILDIKYSGGTDYTAAVVEAFKEVSLEEVNRNVTLLSTEEGREVVEEIKNKTCPFDCSGHGQCVEGTCQCRSGFVGQDCSVDKSIPPENPYIPQNGLCNTRMRACQSTPVLADNLPDDGEVFCGFRRIQIRNHGAINESERLTTKAQPWMPGQVQCPFPSLHNNSHTPDDVIALGYHVSLSNDNQTFSSEVPLVIYDGQCFTCDSSSLTCRPTGQCSPDPCSSGTNTPITSDAPMENYLLVADNSSVKVLRMNFSMRTQITTQGSYEVSFSLSERAIFWTDFRNKTINRANLDGSKATVLRRLSSGTWPGGVAVDYLLNLVFYMDYYQKLIAVMNSDGTSHRVVRDRGLHSPVDIAVDMDNKSLYYTAWYPSVVARMDYNGSRHEILINSSLGLLRGLALDVRGGRMYWTDFGKIESARLDGTDRRVILQRPGPFFVGLDFFDGVLYFSAFNTGSYQLERMNVSGSEVQAVGPPMPDQIYGVAVYSQHPSYSSPPCSQQNLP